MTSDFVHFGRRLAAAFAIATFAASVGAVLTPAMAQDNQTAETQNGEEQANAWVKLCNQDEQLNKEICVVSQELRSSENGALVASLSIRLIEGEKKVMIVAVPVGVLLQPGMQVSIDEKNKKIAEFAICFPNACVARLEVDDAYINAMKKGNMIGVTVIDSNQQGIGYPMTLVGFTKAFDGAPTPPDEYAETQRNLVNAIRERAEQAREAEEGQSNSGSEEEAPAE